MKLSPKLSWSCPIVHEMALEIVYENVVKNVLEIVRLVEDAQKTKAPIHQLFSLKAIESLRTRAFSVLPIIGLISTL